MTPLASVMVLAFLLLIVLALVVWALLQPRPEQRPKEEQSRTRSAALRREMSVTNDDVRGAKVPPKRPEGVDDAFERFLHA
ncbi:MAG: hypothetical protein H0U69_09100, partial [Trueperaceae bacterium]|nr:hypothetical protein [Trueperaceae bacterium]